MARAILRETFIALRARRQAYRVAADFLYEDPIDVETFACRSCGQQIRPDVVGVNGIVRCGVCGVKNQVSPHLRTRQAPPAAMVGERTHWNASYDSWRWRRRTTIYLMLCFAVALLVAVVAAMIAEAT